MNRSLIRLIISTVAWPCLLKVGPSLKTLSDCTSLALVTTLTISRVLWQPGLLGIAALMVGVTAGLRKLILKSMRRRALGASLESVLLTVCPTLILLTRCTLQTLRLHLPIRCPLFGLIEWTLTRWTLVGVTVGMCLLSWISGLGFSLYRYVIGTLRRPLSGATLSAPKLVRVLS